jgi:hypothetical protein
MFPFFFFLNLQMIKENSRIMPTQCMKSFRVFLRTTISSLSSINWLVLAAGTRCFVRRCLFRKWVIEGGSLLSQRHSFPPPPTPHPHPQLALGTWNTVKTLYAYISLILWWVKYFFICQNKFAPNTELRVQTDQLNVVGKVSTGHKIRSDWFIP